MSILALNKAAWDAIGARTASVYLTQEKYSRLFWQFCLSLAENSRVLDIGCGPGVDVTKILAERFDLTALDFSETMIDAARPRVPNARFVCMSATDMPYRDEFDGVVASYCLLCLDPKSFGKACKNIVHALKPGGYAFVALNEARSEEVKEFSAFIEIDRQKMYSRAYSEREVREAFCEMQVVGLEREVVRSVMYGTERSILFLLRKPQRE